MRRVSIVYRFPRRKSPFIAVLCQMGISRQKSQVSQVVLLRQLTTENGRPAQRVRLPPPPPNSQGRQIATFPVYPPLLLRFQWFHSTGHLRQPATRPDRFCLKCVSICVSTVLRRVSCERFRPRAANSYPHRFCRSALK